LLRTTGLLGKLDQARHATENAYITHRTVKSVNIGGECIVCWLVGGDYVTY